MVCPAGAGSHTVTRCAAHRRGTAAFARVRGGNRRRPSRRSGSAARGRASPGTAGGVLAVPSTFATRSDSGSAAPNSPGRSPGAAPPSLCRRSDGCLHGREEHSLGRTGWRTAHRRLLGGPGHQPVGTARGDPLLPVPYLCRHHGGALWRRAVHAAPLEVGIHQSRATRDRLAAGAAQLRRARGSVGRSSRGLARNRNRDRSARDLRWTGEFGGARHRTRIAPVVDSRLNGASRRFAAGPAYAHRPEGIPSFPAPGESPRRMLSFCERRRYRSVGTCASSGTIRSRFAGPPGARHVLTGGRPGVPRLPRWRSSHGDGANRFCRRGERCADPHGRAACLPSRSFGNPARRRQRGRAGRHGRDARGDCAGVAAARDVDRRLRARLRRTHRGRPHSSSSSGSHRGATVPRHRLPGRVPTGGGSPGCPIPRNGSTTATSGRVAWQRQRPDGSCGAACRLLGAVRASQAGGRRPGLCRRHRGAGPREPRPARPGRF